MNKLLIICDRLMYVALLVLIFVLPYSLALIETCQITMMVAWVSKRFVLCKTSVNQNCPPKDFNFFSRSMVWSLVAIALLIVFTIPFSHSPAVSMKKFFSRFLQQIFLMYLVTQIVHNRKRLYSVLAVLLLTFVFVILDVMAQYMTGKSILYHTGLIYGRVSGPMNHPNDLGTLLVTVLPVVLVLLITCRTWIPLLFGSSKQMGKWMSRAAVAGISVLFLFLVIALGLTDSRGAWLAFAVSIIVLGSCLKSRKLMIFIFLMFVVFFGVSSMHCLSTRTDLYNAPMAQGSYNAVTSFFNPSDRGFYWETAVGVIKHYPWFGCGYSAYGKTLRALHVGHEEYPHNSLLQITAELGFLGLILYGWFFTAVCLKIKNVLRAVSRERDLFLLGCGLASGMLAWMIHGLLDTPWASLQLSVLWWLFMGILLSLGFVLTNHEGEKTWP